MANRQFEAFLHFSLGTALLVLASDSESGSMLESEKNKLPLMITIDITAEKRTNKRERDYF